MNLNLQMNQTVNVVFLSKVRHINNNNDN